MKKKSLVAIGERIKFFRLSNNLTQEQLAEISGLHRTYMGSVERGERNISIINLLRIAQALKITVSQLLNDIR